MDRKTRTANGYRSASSGIHRGRVSFWVSAANYYLVTGFIVSLLFIVVLGGWYDGHDDTPWIAAGMAAIVFAALLILFREVVLRRIRQRAMAERELARHLRVVRPDWDAEGRSKKITLERNREILDEIRRKSDAAKVLGSLPEAHREVFDLCERYIADASEELTSVRHGSPRIPAFRKGRRFAAARHRFHMLRWSELKAMAFTSEPSRPELLNRKTELAQDALDAVDRAIDVYPNERALAESRTVLTIFVLSARLRRSIGEAELAEEEGSRGQAIEHYREALLDLQDCKVDFPEREAIEGRIRSEIGRLSNLADV